MLAPRGNDPKLVVDGWPMKERLFELTIDIVLAIAEVHMLGLRLT
jgi:hypothetical protein